MAAEDDAGQYAIWQALASNIEQGDEIVFDITYGLRHQPVVASFSLMLLRWSHKITGMNLYYGAAELKQNTRDQQEYCPVISVDFCHKLTSACEAIATWEATGHYEALGKELMLGKKFDNTLAKVAFADEVNRPEELDAQKLKKRILAASYPLNVPAEVLIPPLEKSLDLASEPRMDKQFIRKAKAAHKIGQHFKAVAYLYESILMAWMYGQNPNRDRKGYLNYHSRNGAKKFLEDEYDEGHYICPGDKIIFMKITYLRNGVLHGTISTHAEWSVEDCITNENLLNDLFQKGVDLYDKIANINSGGSSRDRPTQVP